MVFTKHPFIGLKTHTIHSPLGAHSCPFSQWDSTVRGIGLVGNLLSFTHRQELGRKEEIVTCPRSHS